MQVLTTTIVKSDKRGSVQISSKQVVLVYEIGLTAVPTATDFVNHISAKYNMSSSSVWYMLKKLKRVGVVDFTEKGEEQRPLSLTDTGMLVIRGVRQGEAGAGFRRGGRGDFALSPNL